MKMVAPISFFACKNASITALQDLLSRFPVGQDDIRLVHQRPCYGSALLLAAGDFGWIFIHDLLNAEKAADRKASHSG